MDHRQVSTMGIPNNAQDIRWHPVNVVSSLEKWKSALGGPSPTPCREQLPKRCLPFSSTTSSRDPVSSRQKRVFQSRLIPAPPIPQIPVYRVSFLPSAIATSPRASSPPTIPFFTIPRSDCLSHESEIFYRLGSIQLSIPTPCFTVTKVTDLGLVFPPRDSRY